MRRVAGSKIKFSPTPNCAGGRGPGGRESVCTLNSVTSTPCENKRSIGTCSKLAHLADAGRRGEDKPDWRPCCAAKTWSRRYFQRELIFLVFKCPSDLCSALVPCNKPCLHSAAKTEQPKASTEGGCSIKHSITRTHKARALTMWGHSPNPPRMSRRVIHLLRMPFTVVSADAHAPTSTSAPSQDSIWAVFQNANEWALLRDRFSRDGCVGCVGARAARRVNPISTASSVLAGPLPHLGCGCERVCCGEMP